jgi:hypothetical protein
LPVALDVHFQDQGVMHRRGYERRDHVAFPITKGNDLVALDPFVSAKSDIITNLLRRCRRVVTMDHRDVKETRVTKL